MCHWEVEKYTIAMQTAKTSKTQMILFSLIEIQENERALKLMEEQFLYYKDGHITKLNL